MRAFHNDASIKEAYLTRVRQHRAADELIHGKYWENGRGCAVGCTVHSDEHAAYEDELGIPLALAYLEDLIFEHLPNAKALEWPEAFLSAIPVGADLRPVIDHLMIWLLVDQEAGVTHLADAQDQPAIEQVAALYQRRLAGEAITEDEWQQARSAAGFRTDATVAAAKAAEREAVAYTVAVHAAAQAAARAAGELRTAADLFGADGLPIAPNDIWGAYYVPMAGKLLELLACAPGPAEA